MLGFLAGKFWASTLVMALLLAFTARAEDSTSARNESSVPRNSILPFSPAIAIRANEDPLILKAKLRLHVKGYEIGELDGNSSARFVASLVNFQKMNSLKISGQLDDETKRLLGLTE